MEKHLGYTKTEISALFNRSRHFAKRLTADFYQRKEQNHPFDKEILDNYNKLDMLIQSYVDFKPNKKEQES